MPAPPATSASSLRRAGLRGSARSAHRQCRRRARLEWRTDRAVGPRQIDADGDPLGIAAPESGQEAALGQDIWPMSEREREQFRLKHCGFIFQRANLFAALTARSSWNPCSAGARTPLRAMHATGLMKCCQRWGWRRRHIFGRSRCRAGRSSAWPSAGLRSRSRRSSLPTSRPAPWIGLKVRAWFLMVHIV
jgi:hypothetical protein